MANEQLTCCISPLSLSGSADVWSREPSFVGTSTALSCVRARRLRRTWMSYRPYQIIRCASVALLLWSFALPASAQDQKELAEANRINQEEVQFNQAGRYSEAIPLAKSALALFEEALGPEDPSVASTLNNLAVLYQATGDYARAAPLYERALTILEKAFGPEQPQVANALIDLATVYQSSRDYARAELGAGRIAALHEGSSPWCMAFPSRRVETPKPSGGIPIIGRCSSRRAVG